MKRSEMVFKLTGFMFWNKKLADKDLAEATLKYIEDAGMLPPTNTCKLIDDGKGGVKHSPTAKEWDDEQDS